LATGAALFVAGVILVVAVRPAEATNSIAEAGCPAPAMTTNL